VAGDLEEFVAQGSETVKMIVDHYARRAAAEPIREYLGASIIGEACDRYLWYVHRGLVREEVEGRMFRLWQTGHREEARMLDDLRAIGMKVFDRDANGEQFAMKALGGHFSGHMDAVVVGVPEAPKSPHVAECKTHKDDSFNKLKKVGVRGAKPLHFAQMQTYMGGFKLDRALYLAHNKDTDELYSERVKFEPDVYKALLARAGRVIATSKAPERVASRMDDFRCKFCPAFALCWGVEKDGSLPKAAVPIPAQTCKSCVHSTAITEGEGARWRCERYKTVLETPDVGAKCPSHLLLPHLVAFAEATDSDDGWIEFTNTKDGTKWQHGPGEGQWTTAALMAGRVVGSQRVADPTVGGSASIAEPPGKGVAASPPSNETTAAYEQRTGHRWFRCQEGSCDRDYCGRCVGHLFLCAVCGQAEAELEPTCLLALDLEDIPLLQRYPWADSEKVWSGPTGKLGHALEIAGYGSLLSPTHAPRNAQNDDEVNAAEFSHPLGDVLIVHYKKDGTAAIWRGKS
jgi:hypothetical protein